MEDALGSLGPLTSDRESLKGLPDSGVGALGTSLSWPRAGSARTATAGVAIIMEGEGDIRGESGISWRKRCSCLLRMPSMSSKDCSELAGERWASFVLPLFSVPFPW